MRGKLRIWVYELNVEPVAALSSYVKRLTSRGSRSSVEVSDGGVGKPEGTSSPVSAPIGVECRRNPDAGGAGPLYTQGVV